MKKTESQPLTSTHQPLPAQANSRNDSRIVGLIHDSTADTALGYQPAAPDLVRGYQPTAGMQPALDYKSIQLPRNDGYAPKMQAQPATPPVADKK
jgi:hypothetical protein